jgi:nitric oxide reductase large subunit
MLAAYFSLLSALRIGWSGLNFGTWISRMQLREYSLHATRWVRVASGIQSLISVYMVALAILTYFGTPFEF